MDSEERHVPEVESPGQITDLVEKLGTASHLPNLGWDVVALLALLFVMITYHIQHPTLLFRVPFGETFRDVQEQGFQETMVYALIASAVLLVAMWRKILPDRDRLPSMIQTTILIAYGVILYYGKVADLMFPALLFVGLLLWHARGYLWGDHHRLNVRLRYVMIFGMGFYILHIIALILQDNHFFLSFYNLKTEDFVDILKMKKSEAAVFADSVKALNSLALLGGAGWASIVYLWSPWESLRFYRQNPLNANWSTLALTLGKDIAALIAVVVGFLTYHLIHPIWVNSKSDLPFEGQKTLAGAILFISTLILVISQLRDDFPFWQERFIKFWANIRQANLRRAFQQIQWKHISRQIRIFLHSKIKSPINEEAMYARLKMVIVLGVLLYVGHTLSVLWADTDRIGNFYHANSTLYGQLLVMEDVPTALRVTDWAALLAGVCMVSIFYFWSPWERLMLYVSVVVDNFSAVVVAFLMVGVWEYGLKYLGVKEFLLPRPSAIWGEFKEIYPSLIAGSWFTIKNALDGFIAGCGAGIFMGILSARYLRFSKAVLPLAIAANAVPIIAFAPIFNAWFGLTSTESKVAIVAVLCFFPTMISTVQGLTSVDERELELMESYAASEFEIFRYLRLPTALPFIFSSLKLAATLAMIGAIVAEFFGGTPATALGFRIKNTAGLLKMAESWSAIIVASVLGIGFFLFISVLERNAMPWYSAFRDESD